MRGGSMSHINTLKVYEEYRAAGFDEKTAKDLTSILENSFMSQVKDWLKEAKNDFASQKLLSTLGALILIAMSAGIGLLWYISIELQVLKTCGIQKQEQAQTLVKQDKI